MMMKFYLMILSISYCCGYVTSSSNVSTTSSSLNCLHDQSSALLRLKEEFAFIKPNFSYYYYRSPQYTDDQYHYIYRSYPKTEFWKVGKDCCSWDGVTCNMKTGEVVGLDLAHSWLQGTLHSNSSLFKLHQLQKINLAFNNFSFSLIPSEFGRLSRLTYLNLSFSMFSGNIPSEISSLNNLVSLDLSCFEGYDALSLLYLRKLNFTSLIQNMTNLKQLHLHQVNISSSIPESLANLSSLTSLSLGGCGLHGHFPEKIFHLPKLEFIDVSDNFLLSGFLPQFQPNSSSLRHLFLDFTNFSGKLPYSIGYLRSLSTLSLWHCNFVGPLPSSFWNLTQLTYLLLSWNHFNGYELPHEVGKLSKLIHLALGYAQFSGKLPYSLGNLTKLEFLSLLNNSFSGQIPASLGNLKQLQDFKLSNNSFNGKIPTSFGNLTKLKSFYLSSNDLNGVIPSFLFTIPSLNGLKLAYNEFTGPLTIQNVSSSQLEILYLRANKLDGRIPCSMFKLVNLTHLVLDYNYLIGTVEFGNFSALSKLQFLSLSFNGLSTTALSTTNFQLPKFRVLLLSSCNISEFPNFLKTQDQLEDLDLSNNRIEGQIPKWFWVGKKRLGHLDLSFNKLQGSLIVPPLFTSYFYISGNNLSRRIHSSLRKWTNLKVLDISMNHFNGTIPGWLGNFTFLEALNLQRNSFHGSFSRMFTYGSMHNLKTLDLSHNQLQGKVPQSLMNCSKLQVLNLGHNQISDTFPFWLQNLLELQVLVLRSNKFYGPMWHQDCKVLGFVNLRIIDLSFNSLSGSLPPEYFRNWGGMTKSPKGKYMSLLKYTGDESSYYDGNYSMTMMNKGLEMDLVEFILTIFTSIDLSNNMFEGEIPSSLGNLRSLVVLNLSSNSFTGIIPSSLGNLGELESLDLSKNKLFGRIPQQLTKLTFLEYLNLSQNRLTGQIPQGRQLDTFSSSSFEGNPGLCGSQLSKKCENVDTPISYPSRELDSKFGFSWEVVVIGYGCGLVVGLISGHVTFTRRMHWI